MRARGVWTEKNTLLARDDVVRDDVILEVLLRGNHLRPDVAADDRHSGVSSCSLHHRLHSASIRATVQ